MAEAGIPFYEITLTAGEPAPVLVRNFVEQLNSLREGVVSINGFSTAFSYSGDLESALRTLNFNREELAQPHLRQIWWMPAHLIEEFVNSAPDLNSWFILRYHLTETVAPSDFESIIAQPKAITAHINDAREQARILESRLEQMINAGIPINELQRNWVMPAVNALREAGAEREARAFILRINERITELRKQKYPTRVFISYSHDSPEHLKQVLELSNRLRVDGVNCCIDQYEALPLEGWARWAVSQIENAEYILVACTEGYSAQVRGEQPPRLEPTVNWGGAVITPEIYENQAGKTFFIPIVFSRGETSFVPDFLRGATRYNLSEAEEYDRLYRRITDNSRFLKLTQDEAIAIEPQQDFFRPSIIPYRRNPFFTGRDEILWALRRTFDSGNAIALTQTSSISGLGGIGKTQTAVEYAYRYRDKYKSLLWARADSRESLISDFTDIAKLLNLVEINVPYQSTVTSAVREWLASSEDWLLILDNADDPQIIQEFLPETHAGHILLTSRAPTLDYRDITGRIEEDLMSVDEAAEFVVKRAGQSIQGSVGGGAVPALTGQLEYLPLALDQAGAYIAKQECGFNEYLLRYRQRRIELLNQAGHDRTGKYPASVRATLSLSLEKVKQESVDAATTLQISAFLNPDRIPIELLSIGVSELGPQFFPQLGRGELRPFALEEVLRPLIEYSLIYYNDDLQTYDVHRLVQAIIKDGMDTDSQRQWAGKAIQIVNRAFPKSQPLGLNECERFMTQAEACARLIDEWKFDSMEAASLLSKTGDYLSRRGRFSEASHLYQRSLKIIERIVGPDHPDVATGLTNLANLYRSQGKYAEAEPSLMRALEIRERVLGPDHPDVAVSTSNLANLYQAQGRYEEAESLYYRSLTINERSLGPEHPSVAISLNNLATLYREQAKYAEAESLYLRSLAILEKVLGPD
ncbi:MAG TPA: tetratricopeptide repeat protein, partial [Blastocatellia bacterium]|nr:tetratricopeptide repeat protein [Blastocatellia bacterium]